MKGLPASSTMALGIFSVIGRSRVARPPARRATGTSAIISAFIAEGEIVGESAVPGKRNCTYHFPVMPPRPPVVEMQPVMQPLESRLLFSVVSGFTQSDFATG